MEEQKQSVFRQKTLDRISSPEQLTEYLRVTSAGIWAVLAAVFFLVAGLFAWAAVGTLEIRADVKVIVQEHTALVIPTGTESVADGMPLRVEEQEYNIASTDTDEYGRVYGMAEVTLPDGIYDGTVVLEQTHPVDFLLTNGRNGLER